MTLHKDYIKAAAPVATWERALDTIFYLWEDIHRKSDSKSDSTHKSSAHIVRASSYSLPEEHIDDVAAMFNTVQAPPVFWGAPRPVDASEATAGRETEHSPSPSMHVLGGDVTSSISSLRSLYNIAANVVGSTKSTQTVFAAGNNRFSLDDLHSFQNYYGLRLQDPINNHGVPVSASACASSTSFDCSETNLDIQYLMAVSAVSPTFYYYDPDPYVSAFVTFLLEAANTSTPTLVQSISYGAPEQVSSQYICLMTVRVKLIC